MTPEATQLGIANLRRWISSPKPHDHKYSRGTLGMRIGSSPYPGAAVLGVTAAWRTGIGMVRFVPGSEHANTQPDPLATDADADADADSVAATLDLPSPAALVLMARPETVVGAPPPGAHPCDAWVIGSGTSPEKRSPAETAALTALLAGDAPVVVDAGALDLVARVGGGRPRDDPPRDEHLTLQRLAPTILTPHFGEFTQLWRAAGNSSPPDRATTALRATAASQLARQLGTTILLKGSVTVIATPGGRVFTTGPATPQLATAGTGDVLAGILGAMVAGHADRVKDDPELLGELGAAATELHDLAARAASGELTEHDQRAETRTITALDVAEAISQTVASTRSR